MIPIQFGDRNRSLYGVYHPAVGAGLCGSVMVFCNPLFHEALWCHRPFRVLADALTQSRWHVLRFDYSGTGDSSGCSIDADLEVWNQDVDLAIEEAKSLTGATRVTLLGLRFGACCAVDAAARREDVCATVLWDPISSGDEYLNELLSTSNEGDENQLHGFEYSNEFLSQIRKIDLNSKLSADQQLITYWSNASPTHHRNIPYGDNIGIDSPEAWSEKHSIGSGAVPVELINAIVEGCTPSRFLP